MSWAAAPYHHVEAGAILARCGEDVDNLSYDPVLENVPTRDQCQACRSRMDETSPAYAPPTTENAP
jgi:hypothetical protein